MWPPTWPSKIKVGTIFIGDFRSICTNFGLYAAFDFQVKNMDGMERQTEKARNVAY